MILRTGEAVFVAHFSHMQVPAEYVSKMRASTTCYMHRGFCKRNEEGQCLIAERWGGVASCSVHDQFVKAKGRKLAFSRAVSILPLRERIKLWDAFLNQDSSTKYIAQDKLREAFRKGLERATHAR